ncbi:hypothetical protein [Legionella pneumophila]
MSAPASGLVDTATNQAIVLLSQCGRHGSVGQEHQWGCGV